MTERMIGVLRVLDESERYAMTPNQIASTLGFRNAPSQGGLGGGRGSGAGTAPAQHVIFSLNRLRELGFITFGRREDERSGTAYAITAEGKTRLSEAAQSKGRP